MAQLETGAPATMSALAYEPPMSMRANREQKRAMRIILRGMRCFKECALQYSLQCRRKMSKYVTSSIILTQFSAKQTYPFIIFDIFQV